MHSRIRSWYWNGRKRAPRLMLAGSHRLPHRSNLRSSRIESGIFHWKAYLLPILVLGSWVQPVVGKSRRFLNAFKMRGKFATFKKRDPAHGAGIFRCVYNRLHFSIIVMC